jgi:GTP-binding protein
MKVKNPRFVISAVSPKQYPESDLLEIAFAGRSNVGKSSLLNALVGRKNLAYKGSTQGKTRQINFYNIDDEIHFVDLPGYGYAAVSKGEKNLWAKVVEGYLNVRPQLYLVIMLVDIRHKPSQDDLVMYNWIKKCGVNHIIAVTKSDKLGRSAVPAQIKMIKETLKVQEGVAVIPVSSVNKKGVEKLWEAIDSFIVEEDAEEGES